MLIEAAGGGGYGDPGERTAAARAADLREEYVAKG
jgi:N-methylhydantoinase B/oxoprolinase/acetone carboxylase alpha subunit